MPRSSKLTANTYIVERATATLPQSGDGSLFTITGRVILTHLVGEVTTEIQTQNNATLLKINPTVGADVDLCAALEITGDVVGSLYAISGDFTDPMVVNTSGAVETSPTANTLPHIILAAGIIELECAASNTGAIKWTLHYIPLDINSSITVA